MTVDEKRPGRRIVIDGEEDPPVEIVAHADSYQCDACVPEIKIFKSRTGEWEFEIAHAEGCSWLAHTQQTRTSATVITRLTSNEIAQRLAAR